MTRNLYLLRGVPASGKSWFIDNLGYDGLVVSPDAIRALVQQPVYGDTKKSANVLNYDMRLEGHVWTLTEELVKGRMKEGYTTFVDATHLFKRGMKPVNRWKKIADEYGYRTTVLTINEHLSLEELKANNNKRTGVNKLPDQVIESYYQRLHDPEMQVANSVNKVSINTYAVPMETIKKRLFSWRETDLVEQFTNIIAVGDVHGSYSALMKIMEKDNEDTLFVFTGDWFERGTQDAQVFEWLYNHVKDSNKVFIEGNHDTYLYKMLKDEQGKRSKALFETFGSTGINVIDGLNRITSRFQPLLKFSVKDAHYVVTHSGTTGGDETLQPLTTFTRGKGGYEMPLNHETMVNDGLNPENTFVIHGHRNEFLEEPLNGFETGYFNLEQQVEAGGKLGAIEIDVETGEVTDISVENPEYDAGNKKRVEESLPYAFLFGLRNTKRIKAREMSNGMTAYNFTRDTFQKKDWDKATTTARGLFLDEHNAIAGRGFKKFFNVGENDFTQVEDVIENLQSDNTYIQPKYNGFLLIAFYDKKNETTILTTKSGTLENDYVKMARILLSDGQKEYIDTYLKVNQDRSMLFEVVDNSRDPHIQKANNGVYLLDIINNTLEGESAYDNLNSISYEPKAMRTLIEEEITSEFVEGLHKKRGTEGFVITNPDTNYKVKVKTDEYRAKKLIRGLLNSLNNKGLLEDLSHVQGYYDRIVEQVEADEANNTRLTQIKLELVSGILSGKYTIQMSDDGSQVDILKTFDV